MIMKAVAGVVALKVQASVLFPESFAALSQFMTVVGLVMNISSTAITTGMTVLLARAVVESDKIELIRSGQFFSVILSTLISVICIFLYLFEIKIISISPLPKYLFVILAVLPWLITQSSIAQARLTSSYQLKSFSRISNYSAIGVAVLIITLTLMFGVIGSAIAVAVGPMLTAIILLFSASNTSTKIGRLPNGNICFSNISELLRFSAAMLVAICAVPISHLAVRSGILQAGAADQAGFWSAIVRLSDVYMQFFGLLLTFYILPKISSKTSFEESKRAFVDYFAGVSIISIAVLTAVYCMRDLILNFALAESFRPAIALIGTQLIGDFFRVLLSFFFWFSYGQNLRVLAALEEVLQGALFYFFFSVINHERDAQGAVEAHFQASFLNFVIIGVVLFFIVFRRR